MKAENCIDIFEKAINNYHINDDVYQSFINPFERWDY